MVTQKTAKPAFRAVEADDPMDARLEARAAEKGIPTLVSPKMAEPAVLPAATLKAEPKPAGLPLAGHGTSAGPDEGGQR
jgi:hypothetical protein